MEDPNYGAGWNVYGTRSPIPRPIEAVGPMWRYSGGHFQTANFAGGISPGTGYWINVEASTTLPLGDLAQDSDSDSIPDYWEELWGFDFRDGEDVALDLDEDQLPTLLEYRAGTNPRDKDSDRDSLTDGKDQNPVRHDPYPRPKTNVGRLPYSLTIGDLNADGRKDIVTANRGSDDLSLLMGNGDGTFQPEIRHSVGNNPESIAMGDFNNDGSP